MHSSLLFHPYKSGNRLPSYPDKAERFQGGIRYVVLLPENGIPRRNRRRLLPLRSEA